jgi:hypothetical protein
MSDTVDAVYEEYMKIEPANIPGQQGRIILARQCAYQPSTQKRAVQYMVGTYMAKPPKGH